MNGNIPKKGESLACRLTDRPFAEQKATVFFDARFSFQKER